jgi:hypothetical protein
MLLGQQQANAVAMFTNVYLGLVPVVASRRLEASYAAAADPDAIAEEAESIALAAMRRLGIQINKQAH